MKIEGGYGRREKSGSKAEIKWKMEDRRREKIAEPKWKMESVIREQEGDDWRRAKLGEPTEARSHAHHRPEDEEEAARGRVPTESSRTAVPACPEEGGEAGAAAVAAVVAITSSLCLCLHFFSTFTFQQTDAMMPRCMFEKVVFT